MRAAKDNERAQAVVRLVIGGVAIAYMCATYALGLMDRGAFMQVATYALVFMFLSIVLFGWIVAFPGVFHYRRLLAIGHDYVAISACMIMGGESMLPVFGVMLWVTVGNGMRYGSRYLALATGIALVSIAVIVESMPYLQAQPYVVFMLVITMIAVPAYSHILLRQTREATEQARAANLAKSRFLAQASHDLRQPIYAINLFTACLRDANLGQEEQRMVENIDKSLYSVSQLFRSILDLYTLDNGKMVASTQPVALGPLMDEVARENAEAARWAGTAIRVRPTSQWVMTDPSLLRTILQNLISNAIKYGNGKPILVGSRARQGDIAIEVIDCGRGIPPADIGKVCDEFYRVRAIRDRDIEGLGLGLFIVSRLVNLLTLRLFFRSNEGRGTRVVVEGLKRAIEPAMAEERPSVVISPLTGLHVLLIEDQQSVLQATATLLEKWGCQVSTAASIPDSLVPCDLVVTDFDLGTEASGADCIEYLRQLSGRHIPAVVVTGHDVATVEAIIADPSVPVLSKPVAPADLRSLLASLRIRHALGHAEGA
ncbi:ATP-binding response regulator [Pseudomonas matsuisoli]|uniref:histidine kinase n=1 Tax=Pseudomonas matsuisoli TaxID=1515666 RepID=A0A917UXW1_9PSED|nr:hybrid sensor histidine kinase/response regulator [Pseudomonas matsuisoli]GGJ94307.1 hybrid sensor histidine kinase/response regulator [Pseudomonas matsuisoli]